MTPSDGLRISVVVPTRNRPDHAEACARQLLVCGGFDEVVFVDQSDEGKTEEALLAIGDSRIRCVRSKLRGATNGRNVGIQSVSGDVIAFTDDDCRVARDWTTRIADIFRSDPDAAVICGRVRVPPEIQLQGFAIGFDPVVREWQHRFPPPDKDWGITANLSARRTVFERIGKFDAFLGPGAPLLCGEEPDLLFRVLKDGMKVVNASEVIVDHLGARALGPESTALWNMYGTGTAAALFKHIRLGDRDAASLYLQHLAVMGQLMLTNLVRGRRPIGIRYTLAFLNGAVKSFKFKVHPSDRLYEAQ
ncbi:MAG TPA: glycosyltransferase family A protein [Polyangiaceae bacterium]|jgi:GT2 family glycosyltransferase|nr:glycosyltransferase family A protein [Polyangiaceae bacterium]